MRASLLVLLAVWAAYALQPPMNGRQAVLPPAETDIGMYQRINHAVTQGTDYYVAAAYEHRTEGYPLKPFYTVRSPALAELTRVLGPRGTMVFAQIMVLFCMAAWGAATYRSQQNTIEAVAVALLVGAGGFLAFYHVLLYHELWAGLFVCLAAALYSRKRPELSAVLAFLAVVFREHAILFPFVLGVASLLGCRWRESGLWFLCGAASSSFYAWHAYQVWRVIEVSDLHSHGWVANNGLVWSIANAAGVSLLRLFGSWAFLFASLAAIGWLGYKKLGVEIFAFIAAYFAVLSTVARPDNYYWVFLLHPLLLGGLAFTPRLFAELWHPLANAPAENVGR